MKSKLWQQTWQHILLHRYLYRNDIREPPEIKIMTMEYIDQQKEYSIEWLDENIKYTNGEILKYRDVHNRRFANSKKTFDNLKKSQFLKQK